MSANKLSPGSIFDGKYEIISLLGSGAVGTVYKAKELELERFVAIKTVNLFLPGQNQEQLLQRFKREAKALSLLQDRGILQVYRFGFEEFPYLVCEYVEAESLRQKLEREGAIPYAKAKALLLKIATALDHAHQRLVFHRDLKPENVLVNFSDNGEPLVKLIDFGLCKPDQALNTHSLTGTGELVGTAPYMSPEQVKGMPVDQRSDIYSFACLAFEVFSGKPAFQADNLPDLLLKHLSQNIPRLLELNPDCGLPPELDDLLQAAAARDPEQRLGSLEEFASRLKEIEFAEPSARFVAAKPQRTLNTNTYRLLAASLLVLLILGLAAGAFSYLSSAKQSKELSVAAVKTLLQSGNLDSARMLSESNTRGSVFQGWPPLQQADLLYSYFQIFRDAGDQESALKYLQQYLRIAVNAHKGSKSQDIDWQERILAIQAYLIDRTLPISVWKSISSCLIPAWDRSSYRIDARSRILLGELCQETSFRSWQKPPIPVCTEYCKNNMRLANDCLPTFPELFPRFFERALATARKCDFKGLEAFDWHLHSRYRFYLNDLEGARKSMETSQKLLKQIRSSTDYELPKISQMEEMTRYSQELYRLLLEKTSDPVLKTAYRKRILELESEMKELTRFKAEDRKARDELFIEVFK